MSYQDIVQQLLSTLQNMGLQCTSGDGTDLAIRQEFLSARWLTGKRQIQYEALIRVDEEDQTIYLWEFTQETGSGFSFGSSSRSTLQVGKTVYRKVKSVQYGPDGKAFEISLDLGAIPKTIKSIARDNGWAFKTVLNKHKAQWPEDSK